MIEKNLKDFIPLKGLVDVAMKDGKDFAERTINSVTGAGEVKKPIHDIFYSNLIILYNAALLTGAVYAIHDIKSLF